MVALDQRTSAPPPDQPARTPLPPALKGLSLAEVRLLLMTALPQPSVELPAALDLRAYQRTRKAAAYRSHRKRTLALLNQRRE